ncbi:MAG: Crp/Fnr family transcriptional regulator [Rubrivivax sp.]|nr:Crp/Fnr family transcriptional regulator [Rubrivivax sp.]
MATAPPRTDPPAALTGLRGITLLHGLPDTVLAEVARACRFQLVRARQTVMTRADQGQDCCFIVSGRLRVVALSPGGREVSFRDAGAGETIGEMAALDGRPRSATVVALQESLLARIGAPDLKQLLARHWVICERLLQHLARTARMLTERVYELSTLNVHQRLCAELLRRALAGRQADGQPQDGAVRVVLAPPPAHGELAMRISCTREQVAREMSELARQGLVQRQREPAGEALVIEDLRRLAEHIESLPADL